MTEISVQPVYMLDRQSKPNTAYQLHTIQTALASHGHVNE